MKPLFLPLLFTSLLLLAGCGPPPAPAATAQPAEPTAAPVPTAAAAEEDDAPAATAAPVAAWDDPTLLTVLGRPDPLEVPAALDYLAEAGDARYVPVLIEILRAGQLGLLPWGYSQDVADVLEALSGQSFGGDWGGWIEWYGATDIEPPPGFTTWKGALLAPIDPRFTQFFQEDFPSRIRVEEIVWGGVRLDGIPALDHAAQIPAAEAEYLDPADPVFGLSFNSDSRAYPLRIMDWHEMANDTVGGVPVSIAYCTLCGAAVAYDGRASDGVTYDFGSSGFLYRSNKLMYDRRTNTLWNQLTGQPVLGPLVADEVTLTVLPIVLTTWAEWQAQHPDTTVLSLDTGFDRDYRLGAAYGDYFSSEGTMFPVWQRSDLLPDKSQVYTLRLEGLPKAYPLDLLVAERVSNDTLGSVPLVLVTEGDLVEAAGTSRRAGPVTYLTGAQVRAYERGDYTFGPADEPHTILDENDRAWQVTEEALLGPEGAALPRLGGHLAYWFGWYAFFPQTAVYGQTQ